MKNWPIGSRVSLSLGAPSHADRWRAVQHGHSVRNSQPPRGGAAPDEGRPAPRHHQVEHEEAEDRSSSTWPNCATSSRPLAHELRLFAICCVRLPGQAQHLLAGAGAEAAAQDEHQDHTRHRISDAEEALRPAGPTEVLSLSNQLPLMAAPRITFGKRQGCASASSRNMKQMPSIVRSRIHTKTTNKNSMNAARGVVMVATRPFLVASQCELPVGNGKLQSLKPPEPPALLLLGRRPVLMRSYRNLCVGILEECVLGALCLGTA